jgi:hypothetical protein
MRTRTRKGQPAAGNMSLADGQAIADAKAPAHSQLLSSADDLRARIAQRAYELHAERGYRQGHALEDWVEAERDILGQESAV